MMSANKSSEMDQIMLISMEQMVPSDHLLRKINKLVDFSFVYNVCADLYSDEKGRPSIDPVILVKLSLIQKLFGIRSMRQTIKELEVNVAYRWFLGYTMYDKPLHFGTFSKNYIRRFKDSDIFEQLFSNVLELCLKHAKIDTSLIFVDATHVKACANKKKNHKELVKISASEYTKNLNIEVNKERLSEGKKPVEIAEEERMITVSNSDSESGLFHKGEHKEVFAYSVQTACDKNAFVVAYSVHPGNEHDSKTFPAIEKKLRKFDPKMIVMDAGYKNALIAHDLLEKGITPLFPYTRPKHKEGMFSPKDFMYDEFFNCYICPNNKTLKFCRTTREGYKEYKSNKYECEDCPFKDKCTKSQNNIKVINRHIWQEDLDYCNEIRYVIGNKEIYNKRKETIERVFGLAKETMCYRYTLYKGKRSMEINAALTYAALNLKKLINWITRTGKWDEISSHFNSKFFKIIKNTIKIDLKQQKFNFAML